MTGLSLSLRLQGRRVVVIGGGPVAERKVKKLLAAGAQVTLISPAATPGLQALPIQWVRRPYRPGDTAGAILTIAATGLPAVDRAVAAEADADGRLAVAASGVNGGNAHLMAELHRGPVLVAISTGGTSPGLGRRIRDEVAAAIGPEYGHLAERLGRLRERLQQHRASSQQKRAERLDALLTRGRLVKELIVEVEKELASHEREGDPCPTGGAGQA